MAQFGYDETLVSSFTPLRGWSYVDPSFERNGDALQEKGSFPKVGDRLTRPRWEKDRCFTVEWMNATDLAGVDSYDGLIVYSRAIGQWRLWESPVITRKWTVTTEFRLPKMGETFLDEGKFKRAEMDWSLTRMPVVVGLVTVLA